VNCWRNNRVRFREFSARSSQVAFVMPLQTEFSEPNDNPGFLLWRVTNAWQRQIRAALEPLDLTHVQFVLLASLAWLSNQEPSIPQVLLAQHANTDVMMTSQVVRTLEAKGYLARQTDPNDARAKLLRITPAGLALVNIAIKKVETVDKNFFASLEQPQNFARDLQNLLEE
jgi:MarR family transcriptional regulator, organic hydroperoxide resistance regulator